MATASSKPRRSDYQPELRRRAYAAVKRHGSVRAAAAKMGLSPKRVWELRQEYIDERNEK